MARRFLIAVAVMALGAVFVAPSAQAAFGIEKWEALTCKEDKTARPNLVLAAETGKLFTQSSAHPNFGVTAFKLNSIEVAPGSFVPEGIVKDIRVELPRGLGVNPEATPKCSVAQLEAGPAFVTECPPASQVGTDFLTAIVAAGPPPVVATVPVPVYNVQAPFGVPSRQGSGPLGPPASSSAISIPSTNTSPSTPTSSLRPKAGPPVIGSRLVFNGRAGDGYLTMPSECDGGQTTTSKLIPTRNRACSKKRNRPRSLVPKAATKCRSNRRSGLTPMAPKRPTLREPITVELGYPVRKRKTGRDHQLVSEDRQSDSAGRDGHQPVLRHRPGCLHRRSVRQGHQQLGSTCPADSEIGTVTVETPSLPAGRLAAPSMWANRSKMALVRRLLENSSGSSSMPPVLNAVSTSG